MEKYLKIISESYSSYYNYLKNDLLTYKWDNYFYGLIIISLIVWILEITFPWRKNQTVFRKDFWLDLFYMFFNFFILNLILVLALSNVSIAFFNQFLGFFNFELRSIQLFNLSLLPQPISLLLFFVVSDFVQYFTHRLIHKIPFLWNFHKTHHSAKHMGFATHFRYHWMEPIIYKSILYLPIILIGGFDLQDVFIVHFATIAIGHLNHANLGWDYGILRYIFNNPRLHTWHHAKDVPNKTGINFAISLSIWDYIFKTNHIPHNGRDIELGFEGDENFPKSFLNQETSNLL